MLLEHGRARPGARLCAGDAETGFYRREGDADAAGCRSVPGSDWSSVPHPGAGRQE
jgi:hypothetical protein